MLIKSSHTFLLLLPYVAAGRAMHCAYCGEILTATGKMCRAHGAVIDGYHLDTPKVLEQH